MTTNLEFPPESQTAPQTARATPSPWFGALALVLAIAAIVWFSLQLVRDAEAAQFTRLECSAARVDFGPGWVDPRWETLIAQHLATLPEMSVEDPSTRAELEAVLLELPFVAEVGAIHVLWPDGLNAAIRLRVPVACVRVGDQYLTAAEDGVVLPGLWSAPPDRERGFLPLLALPDEGRGVLAEGTVLDSAGALDGLSIAAALWRELDGDDWARLGRIVIDARAARLASVEEPGAVLWLEGERRVLFGRSPNLDAPGELPVANKCQSLSKALRLVDSPDAPLDWELLDVRWDRPEVLPRGGVPDSKRAGKTGR